VDCKWFGVHTLLCVPWCGVETPWVSRILGEGVCQVSSVVWCVRLCGCFQQAGYFDGGSVRMDYVFPACQVV
jgi:hypothetical protein